MLPPHEMDTMLRNVDLRTTRLEQILPTLATKSDLAAAVALLATKAELAAAVAPLATKAELAAAIAPLATREDLAEVRRHALILNEDVRGDIRMLAEHLSRVLDTRSGPQS